MKQLTLALITLASMSLFGMEIMPEIMPKPVTLIAMNTVDHIPHGCRFRLTLRQNKATGLSQEASFESNKNVHTTPQFQIHSFGYLTYEGPRDMYNTFALLTQIDKRLNISSTLYEGECKARVYFDGRDDTAKIFLCIVKTAGAFKVKDPTLQE